MSVTKIKSSGNLEPATGLGANARKNAAEKLSQLLADTYLLQVKTQYYHWNVTGPHFASLHLLFEGQYNELSAAVDVIAERIRALGHNTPGTFKEFTQLGSVSEDKSLPSDWEAMVRNLLTANETVVREARKAKAQLDSVEDEASVDLLNQRMQAHEKAAWMLRSHLQ